MAVGTISLFAAALCAGLDEVMHGMWSCRRLHGMHEVPWHACCRLVCYVPLVLSWQMVRPLFASLSLCFVVWWLAGVMVLTYDKAPL